MLPFVNHRTPYTALVVLIGFCRVFPAYAADGDSDGWDTTDTPADCDDAAAAVHPSAAEDGLDAVDSDCDGNSLIHRSYVTAMNSTFGSEFTRGAGAALVSASGEDLLRLTRGANAWATMDDDFTFEGGRFTIALNVKAFAGPACVVTVTSSSMAAATRNFAGTGVKVLEWAYDPATNTGLAPGDTITALRLECTGGAGVVDVDWLSVANGPVLLGPLFDVYGNATTMGLPGMGRQSVVRSSLDSSGLPGLLQFVGSDVGGFGWSDDGETWTTANGVSTQWLDSGELGVWEVWARDEASLATQTVLALTGDKDSGDEGGLYYTDNLDDPVQVWTDAGSGLGASKHTDTCANLSSKPIGSGQLIVNEPNDTTDTIFLVASSDPDTLGLYTWTKGGAAPAAQTFNTSLPDGIPSALALDSSGEFLLVGYRPLFTSVEDGALYLCPGDFDAATPYDCELVASDADAVWSGDVRDIEADPNTTGRFFVADGGRRATSATACDAGESTVFVVEAGGTFATTVTVDLYDTDANTDGATVDSIPDWADDTGVSDDYYYDLGTNYDACADKDHQFADTYGELVPPRGGEAEGYEISSIAVDPLGEWLFVFYPLPDLKRDYGCVRTFRTEIVEVDEEVTPWKPFQGWTLDDMDFYDASTHAAARRASVSVTGASADYDAFMVSEPLLEDWAGAGTHDAAFAYNGTDYDLMLGGNFLWRVLPDDGVDYGWDSAQPSAVTSTILDSALWELAWDGESAVFQDSVVNSVAVCPGCAQVAGATVDVLLAAGVSDYKMATMYGRPGTGPRKAADRACEVQMLDSSGKDVAVWADGSGGGNAWMSLINQSDEDDSTWDRGLLYLDDITGDDWCWDGYEATATSGITNPNYINDWWTTPTDDTPDGFYELFCQDSDIAHRTAMTGGEYWSSCQATTGVDYFDVFVAADIGQVVSVAAVADRTALLVAAPGTPVPSAAAGGEGLWMASYTGSAISYAEVPYPTAGVTFGAASCSETEFFAWSSQVQLVFDETSDAAGTTRAWLTSLYADCGVVEVEFDGADPTDSTTTTWTAMDLGACTLDVAVLRGVAVNRDATWLFAYGGPDTTSADGGVCAIDLTGAAAAEQVVDGDDLDIQIETMLTHPRVDDAFYFGGFTAEGSSDRGGVYGLQRRYRSTDGTWQWTWKALSGPGLEHRSVLDLAWGSGDGPPQAVMKDLYVATSGGGVWDLRISSQ